MRQTNGSVIFMSYGRHLMEIRIDERKEQYYAQTHNLAGRR
jgi:hypothetical protein